MNAEHYKAIINLQKVHITTLKAVLQHLLSESQCANAEIVQIAKDAIEADDVDWTEFFLFVDETTEHFLEPTNTELTDRDEVTASDCMWSPGDA